jgi:hypothetical protein
MYRSSELIQRSCDSDSWCCVYSLCMHLKFYALECFALSVMTIYFMLCMNDFLLNIWNLREEE